MAASLPALPTELLLKVIKDEALPADQRHSYPALRATCVELNAKLVHFFGSKYLCTIKVELSPADFLQLGVISRGRMCVYVENIVFAVSTLFEQRFFESSSDKTDISQCSWYSEGTFADMDVCYCRCNFVEPIADFVADGSCSQMLCAAFSAFSNLRTFTIIPPRVSDSIVKGKIAEINSCWSLSCKVLLNAVLIENFALEQLSIARGYACSGIPLSALEMITAHWPK